MTVTLPSATTAISFDYAELAGRADTFTIKVGGQTFAVNTSTTGALFFGAVSTTPFTTFTIADLQAPGSSNIGQGPYPTIDNLSFEVAAVPEASTWAMMILGFAAVAFMAHRRKSKSTLGIAA
jgi:hypothetical protein